MGSAVSGLERTNRTYWTSCGVASRKDGGRDWRRSFCMARCGVRARRLRCRASEGRCCTGNMLVDVDAVPG